MLSKQKERLIAYRCPECYSTIQGLVGRFALKANLLRLKCSCDKGSSLDISVTSDSKIKLSVPCILCKQNHSYTVSEGAFFDRDLFLLSCPYSGMDIAFIGEEEKIKGELSRTEAEIGRLLTSLEAEDISDIQPSDMNDAEILPDPAVYDTLRFVLKDLEEEGRVSCLCEGGGRYDLRFTDTGVQAYCEVCGASFDFCATSPSIAEEYLSLDELKLK